MGLLTCDVSRLADGDGASLDVGEREITDFASYGVGVVTAWSLAFLLDKGMNLSFQEGSVRGNLDFDDGGIASDASQIHAVGRGKVAETVGNEAAVIDLHASYDVWAVAIDHISTIVDGEMGKGAQVATVLAQEELVAVWQVGMGASLGSAVERHNQDVTLRTQLVKGGLHGAKVVVVNGIGVLTEGAEPVFHAVALNDSCSYASLDAGVFDAQFIECLFSRLDAELSEVVGVVVGHAQKVVASLRQSWSELRRGTEGLAVRAGFLLGGSAVAECSLQVSYGQVGT